jgi:SAM-dependent methyltransferase
MDVNRLLRPSDWNTPRFIATTLDELHQVVYFHRKLWEYVAIIHALEDFGLLDGTRNALGLGTGVEPLSFYLANHCAMVQAIDLFSESSQWQEARIAVESAYEQSPFPYARERLSFLNMDMRRLEIPSESVDFVWSCSSIEHVTNADEYVQLLQGAARVLRPGGYCVVTTEFNLAGEGNYMPDLVLSDIPLLERVTRETELRLTGPLDLHLEDHSYNVPFHSDYQTLLPYHRHLPHLWLQRGDLLFTSVLLAFRKDSTLPALSVSRPLDPGLVARFQKIGNEVRRRIETRIEPDPELSRCGVPNNIGGRPCLQSDGAAGFLAYGPYLALPAGTYCAHFLLRLDELGGRAGSSAAARLDVFFSSGSVYKTLVQREIFTASFELGREVDVPLTFQSTGDGFFEFRVEVLGRVRVTYFGTRLQTAEAHTPVAA